MKRRPQPVSAPLPAAAKPTAGPRLTLALILLLAAFLRLFQLTTVPPPLHFDEAMNGNDALENIETGRLSAFYPQNGGREGLLINIQTALIYFFGNEPWLLRLPAAIFGILTVWGIYHLAAEMFSHGVGLWAAFLLATSTWHIIFSRIGLRAIGAPLFAVWSFYFLLDALRRAREGEPWQSRMIVAGILYGAGFHTYIAYRATVALVLLVLIFSAPRIAKAWAIFATAAAIAIAPLAIYFLRHPDALMKRASEVSIFGAANPAAQLATNIWKTILMLFAKGDLDWLHNVSGRPEVFFPVAILFAAGVILAARRPTFPQVLALAWLIVAAAPAVLSTENMPHALRGILMVPAVMILAAVGADFACTRFPQRTAAAIVIAALTIEAWNTYFNLWAPNPNIAEAFNRAGAEIANRINAMPAGLPKYVIPVTVGIPGGMPAPAQTVMFMTRSYTPKQQDATNIHYIVRTSNDQPDGVAFCQEQAKHLQGSIFCLQVTRATLEPF